MQYSPKLKKVIEEIKAILEENDIAGTVVLHTPGHGEYLVHLTTSYSCVNIDEATGAVHFKSNLHEDHGGDVKAQKETITGTANMLKIMSQLTGNNALMLMQMSNAADKALNAKHTSGNNSTHQQQNN